MAAVMPQSIKDALENQTGQISTCIKVVRLDATLGFCDNSDDLVVGGVTYLARTGIDRSAIQVNALLNVDNLDVVALIDSTVVSEEDLRSGVYDDAEVTVFIVNRDQISGGIFTLMVGHIGEIKTVDADTFSAEIRTPLDNLRLGGIVELTSPECQVPLFSDRCTLNSADFLVGGVVTAVVSTTNRQTFTATMQATKDDGYYDQGMVIWKSGANVRFRPKEVKQADETGGSIVVQLFNAMPKIISVGDVFEMEPGCDLKVSTCFDKFNNVVNHQGFPFIAGRDSLQESPDAKS